MVLWILKFRNMYRIIVNSVILPVSNYSHCHGEGVKRIGTKPPLGKISVQKHALLSWENDKKQLLSSVPVNGHARL